MQGTYGWKVQSGAVTFSSGYIFDVAAVAAGDATVNSVVGTTYAGGTVTLTNADATNPRVDLVVYEADGTVTAKAGTPKALTATSGPIPPTPDADELEIARIYVPALNTPAMSASSITDRRVPLAAPSMVLVANVATPTSTTSTSAVDLVTISGLSILVTQGIRITFNWRKTAASANYVGFGLKVNATVVIEATGAGSNLSSAQTQEAEDGIVQIQITPRSTNYLNGVYSLINGYNSSTGAAVGGTNAALANPMPNATITSLAIRAINNVASNAAEVSSVQVWTLG